MKMLKYQKQLIYLIILFNLLAVNAVSQNLDELSTEDWFKYRGGLSLNTTAYSAVGMDNSRDPFYWGLDANLNFTLFNLVNIPLSAHFSKDNNTYSQPVYNHVGVSPNYKYITVHAGYRSMQLSSYSLSGLMFLGGGIEIKPEKSLVKFSGMYGRFAKAVEYKVDSQYVASNNQFDIPGYERWGYGGKLTIGREKHSVDLILFKAKDDVNSIPDPGADSGIKPMENLVVGFSTRNQINEKITFQGEYSLSAFSRDIRVEERKMETFSYINNLGNLFTPRYSSTFNSAYSLGLNYSGQTFSAGLVFKHVDPEYQSLGTTYMSNDLENIYLNLKKSFLKNGVSISGNIGQERNNLNNTLDATNKRVIGSVNCNVSLFKPLNVSITYSNFNANTVPIATTMQDTFKYVQVTENYGINASYQLTGDKFSHNFSISSMVQTMNTLNQNATNVTKMNTEVFNTNLNYNLFWAKPKLNIITSISYNKFQPGVNLDETTGWGPTLGLNKGLLKNKIKTIVMYTYQNNKTSATNITNMNVVRINASYKVAKRQSIRFSLSMMYRSNDNNEEIIKQEEYNARLTYSYVF